MDAIRQKVKPIIAFVGFMGTGKTTLAQAWVGSTPGWKVNNFADGIRQVIENVYRIPSELQKKDSIKEMAHNQMGGKTLRYALRHIGMAFRDIDDHTWTNYWFNQVMKLSEEEDTLGIVVEDLRFVVEFELLNSLGATFVIVKMDSIDAGMLAQCELTLSPFNMFKRQLCHKLPSLKKLGVSFADLHISELENLEIRDLLKGLPTNRVITIDNSVWDSSGDLMKHKITKFRRDYEENS